MDAVFDQCTICVGICIFGQIIHISKPLPLLSKVFEIVLSTREIHEDKWHATGQLVFTAVFLTDIWKEGLACIDIMGDVL